MERNAGLPSAHPFATFSSPYSIFNGPSGLLHLLLAFTNLPYLKLKYSHFQVIGNRMARMTVVYSGQSPCFTSPLDFGGFGFALGSGGFRPQMYKIVALEEESICHCKKKKEKKRRNIRDVNVGAMTSTNPGYYIYPIQRCSWLRFCRFKVYSYQPFLIVDSVLVFIVGLWSRRSGD